MAQLAAALGKATSPESVRAILDEYLRLAHAVTTTTGEPLPTNADLIRRAIDQSSIPSGSSATQRLNTSPIRQEDLRFAAQASAELAKHDEVFRHPVSKSGLLEDVMADVVDFATYLGEDTRPDERQESEADRRFVFRTDNGKLFYVYERGQRGRGEVWIDVSRLEEGMVDRPSMPLSATMRKTAAASSLAIPKGCPNPQSCGEPQPCFPWLCDMAEQTSWSQPQSNLKAFPKKALHRSNGKAMM